MLESAKNYPFCILKQFLPQLFKFLHRYICHICDISQLSIRYYQLVMMNVFWFNYNINGKEILPFPADLYLFVFICIYMYLYVFICIYFYLSQLIRIYLPIPVSIKKCKRLLRLKFLHKNVKNSFTTANRKSSTFIFRTENRKSCSIEQLHFQIDVWQNSGEVQISWVWRI